MDEFSIPVRYEKHDYDGGGSVWILVSRKHYKNWRCVYSTNLECVGLVLFEDEADDRFSVGPSIPVPDWNRLHVH